MTRPSTPGNSDPREFGRIVHQRWYNGTANVDRYQYTYDRDSNVLTKVNTNHTASSMTYTYDGLNRLLSADAYGTASDQTWSLDALGNMNSVTTAGGSAVSRTHNFQNELTAVGSDALTYDDAGNLLTDAHGNHLTYDAWNRLVAVTDAVGRLVVGFVYDGLGRRTQEYTLSFESRDFRDVFYSASWQIIEERTGDYPYAPPAVQNVWSPVYVNALVLRVRGSGSIWDPDQRLYATTDANYDVTAVILPGSTFGTGTVQERVDYTSYGIATFYTGSWTVQSDDTLSLRTRWQGGHYNPWINSYDFQRRFYSPELMRWTTSDPIMAGMNWYAADGANPINFVDPEGLASGAVGSFKSGVAKRNQAVEDMLSGVSNPQSPDVATYQNLPSPKGLVPGSVGGTDVTAQLEEIRRQLRKQWNALPCADQQALIKERMSPAFGTGSVGWDINQLAFNKPVFTTAKSGLGAGANTVTVAGHTYPSEEVNYFLWGVFLRLADETGNAPTGYLEAGDAEVRAYRTAYVAGVKSKRIASLGDDYWGAGLNIEGRLAWTSAGYHDDFSFAVVNINGTNVPPSAEVNKVPLDWSIGNGSTTSVGRHI